MTPRAQPSPPPRLAVNRREAAAALGISEDSFARYVAAEVQCVRRGSLRLYPLAELERWLADHAEGLEIEE